MRWQVRRDWSISGASRCAEGCELEPSRSIPPICLHDAERASSARHMLRWRAFQEVSSQINQNRSLEESGMHTMGSHFLSRGARTAVAAIFLLGTSMAASAQWTASNTSHAWSGYNNAFLFTNSKGHDQFRVKQGSTGTPTSTWESAQKN